MRALFCEIDGWCRCCCWGRCARLTAGLPVQVLVLWDAVWLRCSLAHVSLSGVHAVVVVFFLQQLELIPCPFGRQPVAIGLPATGFGHELRLLPPCRFGVGTLMWGTLRWVRETTRTTLVFGVYGRNPFRSMLKPWSRIATIVFFTCASHCRCKCNASDSFVVHSQYESGSHGK